MNRITIAVPKKRIIAIVVAMAFAMSGGVAVAIMASAHTPTVTATCSQLNVNLVSYQLNSAVPANLKPNHVKVTIDSVTLDDSDFGAEFIKSYTLVSTAPHSYSVIVTAWDDLDPNVPKGWTKTFTGTTEPCVPSPTTTTTTPPPTTTTTTTPPPGVISGGAPGTGVISGGAPGAGVISGGAPGTGVIPAGAPGTGAGGAAQSSNGPLMGLGGLALLLAGAAMVPAIRRRRRV